MHSRGQKNPILVVEDEASIREGLEDVLVFHGYLPTGVGTGTEGLERALAGGWDLILLDVMLPGINGFDICKGVRAQNPQVPIILLTAKGAEEDVIRGFAAGCDDYVPKPFSVKELMARVSALLRRSNALNHKESSSFRFGPWSIDSEGLTATQGKEKVDLTRREIDILTFLTRDRGRIISRRRLLRDVWGFPNPDRVETRTVDVHIAKLRKKLPVPGKHPIETVRGEGYRCLQAPQP